MDWKNGEAGPQCFCGMPTSVLVDEEGECNLLCIFHTGLAGAMFPLPSKGRPDHWPNMSDKEMNALVESGYVEQGEAPGTTKEILISDDMEINLPESTNKKQYN